MSYFNKTVASKDMSGYYLLLNGEYAYNKSYSVGYDFGSIKRLDRYPIGALSTLYICFALKKHDSDFIKAYFDSLKWYREIYMISAEGARNHGLLNVPTDEFFETKHYLPQNLNEQRKIADFIIALDHRIDAQQSLVDNLKKYKRGLSDELFSKNGVTDDWTAIPFSEAFELLQSNTFSRDEMSTENGIVYNIHYGDVLIKYGTVVDLSKVEVPYIKSDVSLSKFAQHSYLRDGDIVIADTAEDYTVGKAVEIAGITDEKALSGLHTIPCRPKLSFAPMYLGYFINSNRFRAQILPLIQGTKVSSISKSEIMKTSVVFPSYEMQSRIASMLYTMDLKIDICNACAQELIRTKEALMQRLFI